MDSLQSAVRALRPPVIAAHWRQWATLALLTVTLGLVTATFALQTRLPWVITLAGALLVNAVLQAAHATLIHRYAGAGWRLMGAGLWAATAVFLLAFPLDDVVSPALVIGVLLVNAGLAHWFLGVTLEPLHGGIRAYLAGVCSVGGGLALLLFATDATPPLIGLTVGAVIVLDGGWLAGTTYDALRLCKPAPQRAKARRAS